MIYDWQKKPEKDMIHPTVVIHPSKEPEPVQISLEVTEEEHAPIHVELPHREAEKPPQQATAPKTAYERLKEPQKDHIRIYPQVCGKHPESEP